MSDVEFFSARGRHGYLANYSRHGIRLYGMHWRTVEHYFQAQKFSIGSKIRSNIRAAKTPAKAKEIAKRNAKFYRRDWPLIREDVMRRAIQAKFRQHPDLARKLLATGGARIVEHSIDDGYWGDGLDGKGLNRMGLLLMELRDQMSLNRRRKRTRQIPRNGGNDGTTLRIPW